MTCLRKRRKRRSTMKIARNAIAAALLWALVTGCSQQTTVTQAETTEPPPPAGDDSSEEHGGWLTDFDSAKELAARKGLPILADFSGSDWCSWCIRLDKEVFSKEAFKSYAGKNFVLFLADYPTKKAQAEDIVKQNKALQSQYEVKGFPTVLVLDKEGKIVARTGYRQGGPEAYIEHLKELVNKDDA
jgi:protein disulfide-isomerase